MKYPVGVQSFEKLRNEGFVYVDKTALVYKLVQEGSSYFLSRPRRFGKSILLTTIEAYFKGQKHLFEGLALADLEREWKEYPVLHLDLNAKAFASIQDLKDLLNDQLTVYEQMYESVAVDVSPGGRFRQLIRAAKKKTGKNVVVLIDNSDAPILQTIGNEELQKEISRYLLAFYSVLKSADADLRFVLLVGVGKLGPLNPFCDFNSLNDITMSARFATLCGITEAELMSTFDKGVEALAENNNQTKAEAYEKLRVRYGGFCFVEGTQDVYNPFSILNVLEAVTYSDYWCAMGLPAYLLDMLKKSDYKWCKLSELQTGSAGLYSQGTQSYPIPLLYQHGYLTIKGYDRHFSLYDLDFPNEEVREYFTNLIPTFSR